MYLQLSDFLLLLLWYSLPRHGFVLVSSSSLLLGPFHIRNIFGNQEKKTEDEENKRLALIFNITNRRNAQFWTFWNFRIICKYLSNRFVWAVFVIIKNIFFNRNCRLFFIMYSLELISAESLASHFKLETHLGRNVQSCKYSSNHLRYIQSLTQFTINNL